VATTDQVRQWYPEFVTNHAQRGAPGFEPVCDTSTGVRIEFPRAGGGSYRTLVHPKAAEAFTVYAGLMALWGETMPGDGGTHNCRNIGDGDMPSLHAYGVAIDLPPNSRKSEGFQAAALAVRTRSGARVWKNLASANDRMHDQIDCSPADLATGIDPTTVKGPDMPDMDFHPPTDHEDFWQGHRLGEAPVWDHWGEYVAAGGSTVPTSRTWPAGRYDISWFWWRFIRPLQEEVTQLRQRLDAHEADHGDGGGLQRGDTVKLV
jgi:hypothetical protein